MNTKRTGPENEEALQKQVDEMSRQSGKGYFEMSPGEPQPLEHRPEMTADQELVYRLKTAIDQRGRYMFRLQDMAAGLAAGQGISNAAARRNIEDRFTEQMGRTPQEYLDHHYDERRERDPARDRSQSKSNGRDRGR